MAIVSPPAVHGQTLAIIGGKHDAAKTDPKAAEIVKRYHTRPEFELFDLHKDPSELNNLANKKKFQSKLFELRSELTKWTTAQGDDLLPHQEPYLTKHSIPEIIRPPKKK